MFSDLFHGVFGLISGVFTVAIQFPQVSLTQIKNVIEMTSLGEVGLCFIGRENAIDN